MSTQLEFSKQVTEAVSHTLDDFRDEWLEVVEVQPYIWDVPHPGLSIFGDKQAWQVYVRTVDGKRYGAGRHSTRMRAMTRAAALKQLHKCPLRELPELKESELR